MTSVLQVGQFYIERYYGRGSSRTITPDTPAAGTDRVSSGRHRTGRDRDDAP